MWNTEFIFVLLLIIILFSLQTNYKPTFAPHYMLKYTPGLTIIGKNLASF